MEPPNMFMRIALIDVMLRQSQERSGAAQAGSAAGTAAWQDWWRPEPRCGRLVPQQTDSSMGTMALKTLFQARPRKSRQFPESVSSGCQPQCGTMFLPTNWCWLKAGLTAVMVMSAVAGAAQVAQEGPSPILWPAALKEIAQVKAEIDRIETQALERLLAPPDNQVQQVELLGKLMLYDKELSVNRNEACAFCHTPETGFTGPVSELNPPTGSDPRSGRTRF